MPQVTVRKFKEAKILFHELLSLQIQRGVRPLFRGQGNADWGLIPGAFRTSVPLEKEDSRVITEFSNVASFVHTCDVLGLTLPSAGREFFRESQRETNSAPFAKLSREERNRRYLLRTAADWPSVKIWSLLGLAQHHGVSTRLLDWTWDMAFACYFAAASACHNLEKAIENDEIEKVKDKKIAIWILYLNDVFVRSQEGEPSIELIRTDSSQTPRLSAQRGVFTLLRRDKAYLSSEDFDMVKVIERREYMFAGQPPLIKYELPYSQAPFLMDMADRSNANLATAYPSYDSAVGVRKEKKRTRRQITKLQNLSLV